MVYGIIFDPENLHGKHQLTESKMSLLPLITIILVIIELLYFRLANRYGITDKPNDRSSHAAVTLRGGGVIFPVAALLYACLAGVPASGMSGPAYPWFMAGLILISVVSFRDDIKPLSTKVRLGVQFLALSLIFHQLGLFAGSLWLVPVLLVLCAGIINAWNFMDGINGMTGGYSLVVLGTLAWVNHSGVPFVAPGMSGIILASLLVFNFFNFRTKAVCFAGDVGSVSIACVILFVLGSVMLKTRDFSWICFLAVYGVDSIMTILHRIVLRENITKPHRKHLYQLLANELKIPHVYVSWIYASLQFAIIIGYLLCRPVGVWMVWSYIGAVVFLLAGLYVVFKRKWFHLHRG